MAQARRTLWMVWRYQQGDDGEVTRAARIREGFRGGAEAEAWRDGYLQAVIDCGWDDDGLKTAVSPEGELWHFAVSSYVEYCCRQCEEWFGCVSQISGLCGECFRSVYGCELAHLGPAMIQGSQG